MVRAACCSRRKYGGSEKKYIDSPWWGEGVQQGNAYSSWFCWQEEPGIAFWYHSGTEAYEPRLTVVWVRREAGNRFFSYKVLLIKLGISLMQFLNLLCGKDLAIIDFNSWILLDPFDESGLGNAVFFADLGLVFSILVEWDKGFFEIFNIFGIVVCSHKIPPFWCLIYCDWQCVFVSTFFSIDRNFLLLNYGNRTVGGKGDDLVKLFGYNKCSSPFEVWSWPLEAKGLNIEEELIILLS